MIRDHKALHVNKFIRSSHQAKALKNQANKYIVGFSAGTDAHGIHVLIRFLEESKQPLVAAKNEPSLTQLAQDLYNDATYDHVAEITSLLNLVKSAANISADLIPKDGNGRHLTMSYDASHNMIPLTFTALELAPVISALQAIVASVE